MSTPMRGAAAAVLALAPLALLVPALAMQQPQPALSITGRVIAAGTGRPIPGATVSLGQADFMGRGVSTDTAGAFEQRGLSPGRYRLSVAAPGYMTTSFGRTHTLGRGLGNSMNIAVSAANPTFDVTITMHRGATIAGRVTDDRKEPVVGATVRAFTLTRIDGEERVMPVITGTSDTDDRGDYRIIALPAGRYLVGVMDRLHATFAPFAAEPTAATIVTLDEDAVRPGVNIQARFPPRGSIEGVVSGPGAAGSPELLVRLRPDPPWPGLNDVTTRPEPGGRFTFGDVPAGRYLLIVQPGQQPGQPRASGYTPIVVAPGAAPASATITLREGGRVSGRVAGDYTRLRDLRVQLAPLPGSTPDAASASAQPDADYRFAIGGIAPGRYAWRLCSGQQFGDMVCRVRAGGRDISDEPLQITADTRLADVEIDVVSRPGSLTGIVRNVAGSAVLTGAVIVASTDPRHWTPATRRVVAVRPDTAGEFEVRALPPGEYFAAHVATLDEGQQRDPAFLRSLVGTRVTIGAAGAHRVEVRLPAR